MKMIAAALRPRAARAAAAATTAPPVALPDAPPPVAATAPPPPIAPRAAAAAAAGRVEAAAAPPSPPPDDDASDACASPPAAHRWRRYYDAETRAHYWYDARTQVVSWSDPERPPRDPAHARRPTAASLARSLPGSPQRLRFHCCAVESADSEPEEEPKPARRRRRPAPGYLKARRTPRAAPTRKASSAALRRRNNSLLATPVVGHEGLEGRPHTLVHAAGLPPGVDVDVRERADRGRVFIIFGEEPELVRRARPAWRTRRPTSTGVGHESCRRYRQLFSDVNRLTSLDTPLRARCRLTASSI